MFLFISSVHSLIYTLTKQNPLKVYSHDLIPNQITQGSVAIIGGINSKYALTIESEGDRRTYYHSPDIDPADVKHFSFVNSDAKQLKIYIEAYSQDDSPNFEPGLVRFSFNSKFNTFDKNVAKEHAVEPAMKQLIEFEKLLQTVYLKTEAKKNKLIVVIRSQKTLFTSISYLSFFLFILFAGVNVWQMKRVENFFKKKKLL